MTLARQAGQTSNRWGQLWKSASIWVIVIAMLGSFLLWSMHRQTHSNLQGTVTDTVGRPVPGATIVIARRASGGHGPSPRRAQLAETKTDEAGHFSVSLKGELFSFFSLSNSGVLIVAAVDYKPIVQSFGFPTNDETLPSGVVLKGGYFSVTLQQQVTRNESDADSWNRLANSAIDLYIGSGLKCMAREMPELLLMLRHMSRVHLGPVDTNQMADGGQCAL